MIEIEAQEGLTPMTGDFLAKSNKAFKVQSEIQQPDSAGIKGGLKKKRERRSKGSRHSSRRQSASHNFVANDKSEISHNDAPI